MGNTSVGTDRTPVEGIIPEAVAKGLMWGRDLNPAIS